MRAISLEVHSFEDNKGRSYCISYHYLIDQLRTTVNGFTFLVGLQIYKHWKDVTDSLVEAGDAVSHILLSSSINSDKHRVVHSSRCACHSVVCFHGSWH